MEETPAFWARTVEVRRVRERMVEESWKRMAAGLIGVGVVFWLAVLGESGGECC
jgi:hypothetical protein